MPKGYWVVRVDIDDMEQYKKYVAANGPVFAKYGAKILVRSGPFENPEGSAKQRNVVIEFPSYQQARDCWHSPEYQEVMKLRANVARADLVIIEGYEGPQP